MPFRDKALDDSNEQIAELEADLSHAEIERQTDARVYQHEIGKLKDKIEKMTVWCENCGREYAETGLEVGCTCEWYAKVEELKAELATERAKRCETCAISDGCRVYWTRLAEGDDSTDFGCTRWEKKGEE